MHAYVLVRLSGYHCSDFIVGVVRIANTEASSAEAFFLSRHGELSRPGVSKQSYVTNAAKDCNTTKYNTVKHNIP